MLVWVVVSNIFEKIHPETWGFMIQFDEHILQMGCFNHQLVVFWRVYVWSIQSELASVSISSTAVVEECFFYWNRFLWTASGEQTIFYLSANTYLKQ